ncbi:hypothetical protein Leryth_014704 [Lithospermum erythrorhizon]|nr:hypothetical protein Leryth_014704 [Lithospermum erythrorhizon]
MMYGGGGSSSGGGIGGGTVNCQDCGNKAKKDCPHMRCRSCCKSQGFHCETHIKSTWVPAARRRQKQHQQLSSSQQEQQQLTLAGGRGGDNYYSERSRDNNNPAPSSSLVSSRLVSSSSGLDMSGQFPPELNSPAVFRCVRVSSAVDEEEEQYAYQTAVNIGGHVFKGILYDQGPDSNPFSSLGGGSLGGGSGGGAHHHHVQQQPLDLITAVTTTTTTAAAAYPYAYHTPQNAFMGGTQFFPPPRP